MAGALTLTACAQTRSADQHTSPSSQVVGHPAMPGDNLPNPAKVELEGPALERMQSGAVMSSKM